ncbi:MAG: hypothetical protein EOO01_38820 [Chitinophagaceae bacterium]|nr:MAG: hypothetical protein EOO01_38820 [Chitinophagaceae bacterium]
MYERHKGFEEVDNEATLWRYHDLARYINLLLKRQLFFCRADRFEDPFEGKNFMEAEKDRASGSENTYRLQRSLVTLNSWHLNKAENYAMWKIYARGSFGLAIQTNFEKLKQSFQVTDKPVYIGKVSYYEDSVAPDTAIDPLCQFLRKRNIYQYENEVRCCYLLSNKDESVAWQEQGADNGIFIDVDINMLIERVYISPYSPRWISDIITGLHQKFGIEKEVIHSTVLEDMEY